MKNNRFTARLMAGVFGFAMLSAGAALADEAADAAPPGRSIAYVIYDIRWAVHETKDAKQECPQGLATLGPRELYKVRFPEDGTKRKLVDTELLWEKEVYWPDVSPDKYPFVEAGGNVALGLDLDGQVKATDFTSPEGKRGIDNQLYRAIGCITNYRVAGSVLNFDRTFFKNHDFNRILIELTDVDSLANDSDVTITTYRGRDKLMNDATGSNFQPGSTQRIDMRFGKQFIKTSKGKIVDGTLITEPMEFLMPTDSASAAATVEKMRDARFELRLTGERAEGLIGGHVDVEHFYANRNRAWSTHHEAYGQQTQQSLYKVLRRLADGFPNAKGENTAISGAFDVKMVQVFTLHPGKEIAGAETPSPAPQEPARR